MNTGTWKPLHGKRLPHGFSIQPLSAWLQSHRCNAVGIAWVTRVLPPHAEAHKSDCASHYMGYFIQQHKNMCAHTDTVCGCFLKCIYSWNVAQVPEQALVGVAAGFTGTPSVWRRCLVCAGGQERPRNRWTVRRRPDAGALLFSFTGYEQLT